MLNHTLYPYTALYPWFIGSSYDSIAAEDVAIVMLFAAVGYAAAYSQQRWFAMPHAVEEYAPGPPSPQNGALLAAGLYGANIAYNVINKRVLLAHPHPCLEPLPAPIR